MAQTQTRIFPDGDYSQRLNDLWQALELAIKDEAKRGPETLLAGEVSAVEQLTEDYTALRAEAEADAETKRRVVTLRAIGRREWRPLKVKHQPRTVEQSDEDTAASDRLAGVNTETVGDDLLYAAVVRPEFTSRGAFDEWAEDLTEAEYQTLLQDAWRLVNVAQYDPKSLPASQSQRNVTN